MIEITDNEQINDEDLELLKDLFGNSEDQKKVINYFEDLKESKNLFSDNSKFTKVILKIDNQDEYLPQFKRFHNGEINKSKKIKKKLKKKELISQIYEAIPLIQENNSLLKELIQKYQTIDAKFKALTREPIKIKVVK